MNIFSHVIKASADALLWLLYPPVCHFCGRVSPDPICPDCADEVVYVTEPVCKKCGKPILRDEDEYCGDCVKRRFNYEQGKSLWIHKGRVPWSVYQFKYHNRRIFGKFYADEMCRLYGAWVKSRGIDLIIPVPVHKKRLRKRGYNQAEIIAVRLGRLLDIPVDTHAVKRVSKTTPQKMLGARERRENLRGAFCLTRTDITRRKILIVDDIYTTGSTIDEMARILTADSGNKVWFLTVSIGQDF